MPVVGSASPVMAVAMPETCMYHYVMKMKYVLVRIVIYMYICPTSLGILLTMLTSVFPSIMDLQILSILAHVKYNI